MSILVAESLELKFSDDAPRQAVLEIVPHPQKLADSFIIPFEEGDDEMDSLAVLLHDLDESSPITVSIRNTEITLSPELWKQLFCDFMEFKLFCDIGDINTFIGSQESVKH